MGMSSKTGVLPLCPPLFVAFPFPFAAVFFDSESDSSACCIGAELLRAQSQREDLESATGGN